MNSGDPKNRILWIKALFNGLLAWIIGFILLMLPAFVVAIKMGVNLGPKSKDPASLSNQISQKISSMYQDNLLLTVGFIIITALLIFWRAKNVAKGTGEKKITNGLIVPVFPVVLNLLFMISTGFDISSILGLIAFLGAGYAGGVYSK